MMKSSFRQMLAGDHPLGGSAAAKTGDRKPEPGHQVVDCHCQNPERDPAIVLHQRTGDPENAEAD